MLKNVTIRPTLPNPRKGGIVDERAAKTMIQQWGAGPKTPDEAKALLQLAATLDFGSQEARDTVTAFLDEKLPTLVQIEPTTVANRNYKNDIASQTWNGPMDKGGAKALTKVWGAKPIARIQEQQLLADIAQAEVGADPAVVKELEDFKKNKLGRLVKDDVPAQFAAEAAKGKGGKIDERGAKDMIKGWTKTFKKHDMPLAEANEIRTDVTKYAPQMDASGKARLDKFVAGTLSSLVLKQDLNSPHKVTLGWTPPDKNTDGSPLTDLVGYKVLMGPTSGNYTYVGSVTNPAATSFDIQNVPSGVHFFSMTALDAKGNESVHATEISATVP